MKIGNYTKNNERYKRKMVISEGSPNTIRKYICGKKIVDIRRKRPNGGLKE